MKEGKLRIILQRVQDQPATTGSRVLGPRPSVQGAGPENSGWGRVRIARWPRGDGKRRASRVPQSKREKKHTQMGHPTKEDVPVDYGAGSWGQPQG